MVTTSGKQMAASSGAGTATKNPTLVGVERDKAGAIRPGPNSPLALIGSGDVAEP